MQLTYRGLQYQPQTHCVEPEAIDMNGIYRGQSYNLTASNTAPDSVPVELKYRGVNHSSVM